MSELPTVVDVLTIHELLLETFGGMRGITEHGFGLLESAIAAPQHSMFGEDLYPDLPSKAAALFHGLVRAHALSDGNKRVALVALLDMLERNGQALASTGDELYHFVMQVADGWERDAAEDWIRPRLVSL